MIINTETHRWKTRRGCEILESCIDDFITPLPSRPRIYAEENRKIVRADVTDIAKENLFSRHSRADTHMSLETL